MAAGDSSELLAAVRKASSPRTWSAGVTIARGQRVALEREEGAEITLRVSSPQQPVPFVVLVNVEDREWSCDCPSREDPCPHVVAACIALNEAKKSETELVTSSRRRLTVEYALVRKPLGLIVERSLVETNAPESTTRIPLENLERAIKERQSDTDFDVSDRDFKIERLLERAPADRLLPAQLTELLKLLSAHPRVRFAGEAISIDSTPLLPKGIVRTEGGALVFSIEADPALEEVILPELGRAGGALRPLGEAGLAGASWQNLPSKKRFERREWAKLVGEMIPLMEERIPIEVEAKDLPRFVTGISPRIDLGAELHRGGLSVEPRLVYGRPAQIAIEQGQPVYLRGPVPERDQIREHELLARLRDELHLVPGRRVSFSGSEAQSFLEKLRSWGESSGDEALDLEGPALDPRIVIEGDRFEVVFERAHGEGESEGHAEARSVVEAWLGGFRFVALLEGGFAPLPIDWLESHGHRLMALLAARNDRGELPAALLPDLAVLAESLDAPPPPALEKLRPLLADFSGIPPVALPADLTAELRKYQEAGVRWLSFLRSAGLGGVLADDMGLGKTLQTICVFQGRSLVVCPTSVLENWQKEIARFRPSLKVCLYHGPRRTMDEGADVVITSYALLRLDLELLRKETWEMVVLDEAQAIKSSESQTARAAFSLEAKFRVSLSGTPLENKLEELWSQLHFTNPGLLGGRKDFEDRYARPIGEGHPGRAAELRQRIRPFVLRRMKEEVAPELPPRTDMVLYAELSETERRVYEAVHAATRAEVLARLESSGDVLGVLEALLRLRQAACHSALVPGQHADSSSKLEVLIESLLQVASEHHRALVFSQWTSLLDLVEKELDSNGLGFVRLDGSTVDRSSVIERFRAADGPPVFLISLKAGGTGLNLTEADHVFFLDPWWNPAVEQQAADRTHRIGQTKPVFVYRIVAKDTVEERILLLQDKKRALAKAALGESDQAARITREDLLALLD
jgi:superfamily II DNA or RNA helicase